MGLKFPVDRSTSMLLAGGLEGADPIGPVKIKLPNAPLVPVGPVLPEGPVGPGTP